MDFAFSEEQEELRKTVRSFLEQKSPSAEVRRLMETTEGYDPAVWKQMGQELGLQGLAIPAFDARPAGQAEMTPEAMLGWTPFSYPFNLTQQPAAVRVLLRQPRFAGDQSDGLAGRRKDGAAQVAARAAQAGLRTDSRSRSRRRQSSARSACANRIHA